MYYVASADHVFWVSKKQKTVYSIYICYVSSTNHVFECTKNTYWVWVSNKWMRQLIHPIDRCHNPFDVTFHNLIFLVKKRSKLYISAQPKVALSLPSPFSVKSSTTTGKCWLPPFPILHPTRRSRLDPGRSRLDCSGCRLDFGGCRPTLMF